MHPHTVQGLGVPRIAQAAGMRPAQLLAQAGVSLPDAVQAGLHIPQLEYCDDNWNQWVGCSCARPYYKRNPVLGAIMLSGLLDDAASAISNLVGGAGGADDPSSDPDTSDASYQVVPNNDGTFTNTVAPVQAPQMSDGWPASPPFRPGNWFFGTSANPTPTYTIATGDTLSGLARLYLGDPSKWQSGIWDLQSYKWTLKPDPSSSNPGRGIQQGDVLVMPFQARDQAQKMLKTTPAAPPTPGAPGTLPNAVNGLSPSAPGAAAFFASHEKAILAVGGLAVVGGIAYAVWG